MSQLAVTLHTARIRVFVKGMRQDHRDAWTQQREAAANPYIVPLGARVLWRVVAGGWDLLGFEHLTGRGADYSPASADLALVVEAMTALGGVPSPDPDVELAEAGQRWSAYLDDPADVTLFTGTALLHIDWNPTNVLITAADAAHLVDWSHTTRGAAWTDPACWVVWLGFAGHTPQEAERWAAEVPAWCWAPIRALDLFVTAQARFWQATADAHFHPWTQRLRDAAAQWVTYRTGA